MVERGRGARRAGVVDDGGDGEGRRFVVTAIINHKNAAGAAGALDNLVQWVYQNGATWNPALQH